MRTQLTTRLSQLRQEFEQGQKLLAELDARAAQLRETLLRISGAVQVLEEELSSADSRQPVDENALVDGA